jgi:hypothetical protein
VGSKETPLEYTSRQPDIHEYLLLTVVGIYIGLFKEYTIKRILF